MAFCGNCGKELEGAVKFCPACGAPAAAPAPAAEPVYEAPQAEPVYTAPVYEAPQAAPAYNNCEADVEQLVNDAFGSGLAATICAGFPVASIIAIGKGSKALKKREEAQKLAETYGLKLPGKNIAAKILGMIGKIAGIVMTVFWPLYIIILIAALA